MSTVGQALVAGLAARGVEVVFGIPGVHTIELYRGLDGAGIRHVTARHEQGAGFMADGYARVSGRPGVAFVITGPGVTNILTAMAQARADSVPMLVISSVNMRDTLGLGLGNLHELPDQRALVAQVALHSERLEEAAALGPALDRAFAAMLCGRPGPVHLEVPMDVLSMPCSALPSPAALPPLPHPTAASLGRAAVLLMQARAPIILAGGGVQRAGEAALRAVAERLDAPVVQTVNARGLMHGHPLTVAASPSLDAVRALIAGADTVLAVGTELGPTDYDMYVRGGGPDLSDMIRIDIDAAQLARHPCALPLLGDAGAVLAGLSARLDATDGAGQGAGATRAATARSAARAGLEPGIQAQADMTEAVRDALPGCRIVGDSTALVYAGNLCHDHDLPRGWFNAATGYGALGYGPGAAVGAALADPGRRVVCLIGDGGLQFSPGEMMTAADAALPVTFLVWNNRGFGEIALAMSDAGAPVIGCDPTPPDHEKLAAAYGIAFRRAAATPAALCQALADLPEGRPSLVEIIAT